MRKLLLLPILILAIVTVYSCQNEEFVDEPLTAAKPETMAGIRSIDDVIAIADHLNPAHSRSGDVVRKLHCNIGHRTINNPHVDTVFTAWTGAYTFNNSMLYGVQGCTDHVNFTFYSIH